MRNISIPQSSLSRASASIFLSPPLLLFRKGRQGASTRVYPLRPLFSPLLPRVSRLRTGAGCLCLGPGKVAEGEYVQRRGQLLWDGSQDPSPWLSHGGPGGAVASAALARVASSPTGCLAWSLHVFGSFV